MARMGNRSDADEEEIRELMGRMRTDGTRREEEIRGLSRLMGYTRGKER